MPPALSPSNQPRSVASSSPLSEIEPFETWSPVSMWLGTSAPISCTESETASAECMTWSFSSSGTSMPPWSANVITLSSPPRTDW